MLHRLQFQRTPLRRALTTVFLMAGALAGAASPAGAAIDIEATFDGSTLGDWTGVHLPNPEGDEREEAFTLQEGGPLGTHYARLLLDSGWKVGQSGGERVSLVGQWGEAPANEDYESGLRDAAEGTEYWYIEAFRIPQAFSFGPEFTIVSEWHGNSASNNRPKYNQAPWKFNLRPHGGTLFFNVFLNTGKQFGDGANAWEINGWNTDWSSTEPSGRLRVPKDPNRETPMPEGEPIWLAPVEFGEWQYFVYRIRWRNGWDGIFECWTRVEGESTWRKVANYRGFPTRVYQDGDEQANLYAIGNYYRGNGGTRQYLDYGGRARSNSVADADQGTESTGFQELTSLIRDEATASEGSGAVAADEPASDGSGSWAVLVASVLAVLALFLFLVARRRRA